MLPHGRTKLGVESRQENLWVASMSYKRRESMLKWFYHIFTCEENIWQTSLTPWTRFTDGRSKRATNTHIAEKITEFDIVMEMTTLQSAPFR
jgi:hypothetical protein